MNEPDMTILEDLIKNRPQTNHCMARWSELEPEPKLTPQLKVEILEWLQVLGITPQSKAIDKSG